MDILLPVLIVAVIGLVAGAGLSIASVVMAVKVDEKAEKIREVLPGANCGACGYSGCDGYAAALSSGKESSASLCAPGGPAVAAEVAAVLGIQAQQTARKAAVVRCNGTCNNTTDKMIYHGVTSCLAAVQLFGGQGSCQFGCLGFGDCVDVCEYDALKVRDGVAVVDETQCTACARCTQVCPKQLIALQPMDGRAVVRCMNRDKGAVARKKCQAACIGCMKCEKVCESGAVKVTNFLAQVDSEKCIACGKCVDACPQKCLILTGSQQRGQIEEK